MKLLLVLVSDTKTVKKSVRVIISVSLYAYLFSILSNITKKKGRNHDGYSPDEPSGGTLPHD